jgi:hypothetical protein
MREEEKERKNGSWETHQNSISTQCAVRKISTGQF